MSDKRFYEEGRYRSIDALQHMAQTSNWIENNAHKVFLAPKDSFEETEVSGRDRVWLARAILSLTRDELMEYYDAAFAAVQKDEATGGDFTSKAARLHLPHLYPDAEYRTAKYYVNGVAHYHKVTL